jgi:DNA polymerase III delta prime subunit
MNSIEYIYEFYKNQPSQLSNINSINEWFIQLEKVKYNKHIKTENKKNKKPISTANVLLIVGNTGIGKCLDKNTLVLIDIDIYKPINSLNIGDVVLDPFGKKRLITHICYGITESYYYIKYTDTISYRVTSNHQLVLYNTKTSLLEYIRAESFYNLSFIHKEIYRGIDIIGNKYDINIDLIINKLEYIGITVENELFVIENGIITHNSNLVNNFLSKCSYDILDIGKLFEIYENSNIYSIKDFIPKILKQKHVTDVWNKKLLLIDSLDEFMVIQKTIIRDIIESVDTLDIPIIIVCDRNGFDILEKKMITKLKKEALIIHLENPNRETLINYINTNYKNNVHLKSIENVDKIIEYSKGDIRNLNNMIQFYNIMGQTNLNNIEYQYKDYILDTDKSIIEFNENNITDCFHRCESDPFIFGMLTYENYIHSKIKDGCNIKNVISMICYADYLEKKLFKYQQWDLLEVYSYYSTIYPWKQLEKPKNILSSSTLQKYMNTKKRNRKNTMDF